LEGATIFFSFIPIYEQHTKSTEPQSQDGESVLLVCY